MKVVRGFFKALRSFHELGEVLRKKLKSQKKSGKYFLPEKGFLGEIFAKNTEVAVFERSGKKKNFLLFVETNY